MEWSTMSSFSIVDNLVQYFIKRSLGPLLDLQQHQQQQEQVNADDHDPNDEIGGTTMSGMQVKCKKQNGYFEFHLSQVKLSAPELTRRYLAEKCKCLVVKKGYVNSVFPAVQMQRTQ